MSGYPAKIACKNRRRLLTQDHLTIYWHICLTPQALLSCSSSPDQRWSVTLQIKNIKLHIVTDIKVTINSLSAFGFRYLVGGRVTTILKKTMPVIYTYVWSVYIYLLKCMTVICVSCTCTLYMHTVRLCVHYVCFYVYMLCSCMPRHIKWNSGKTVRISLSIALYLMHARIQLQTTNIRKSMFPHCAAYFHKNIIETLKGMYLCIWMHINACRNVSARFYIHTLVHLFMHGFTYIYPHAATCLHIYPIPHIYTYM